MLAKVNFTQEARAGLRGTSVGTVRRHITESLDAMVDVTVEALSEMLALGIGGFVGDAEWMITHVDVTSRLVSIQLVSYPDAWGYVAENLGPRQWLVRKASRGAHTSATHGLDGSDDAPTGRQRGAVAHPSHRGSAAADDPGARDPGRTRTGTT